MPAQQVPAENQPRASSVKSGETAVTSRRKSNDAPAAASRKAAPEPYVPPAVLIFKPKEQAPRTIYLDK